MRNRILFAGDLHGNLERAKQLIKIASESNCSEIIQAGDWGFIWPSLDTHKELSSMLDAYNIGMRFCDGNHDVHSELRKLALDTDNNLAPKLTYQFRGSVKEVKGIRIAFLGGAPSIDYRSRIEGLSWWPEETITEEEFNKLKIHSEKGVNILVTHDTSNKPKGFKESSNITFNYRAAQSIRFIQEAIRILRPQIHIHGHYHFRFTTAYLSTVVEALAHDGAYINDNYVIVDTNDDPIEIKILKKDSDNGSKKREAKE